MKFLKSWLYSRRYNLILSLSAIIAMWAVWTVAYFAVANDYIIPSFADTCRSMLELLGDTAFYVALLNTLLRTLIAFVISFTFAMLLAMLCLAFSKLSAFIQTIMIFLRTLPTLAVILVLLIWTTPKIAPVIVTVLVLFPMIYAQINASFQDVSSEYSQMATVYNFTLKDRLFKMYFPLILPNILSQTGANISLGLKIMISAEVMASTFKSLGGLMQNARLYVDMSKLAALTLFAVLAGLLIELIFALIKKLAIKWRKGAKND